MLHRSETDSQKPEGMLQLSDFTVFYIVILFYFVLFDLRLRLVATGVLPGPLDPATGGHSHVDHLMHLTRSSTDHMVGGSAPPACLLKCPRATHYSTC